MAHNKLSRVKPFINAALTEKTTIIHIGDSNIGNGDAGFYGYQVGWQEAAHGDLGYGYVGSNTFGGDGSGDDAIGDAIFDVSIVPAWEAGGSLTTIGDLSDINAAGDTNGPCVGLEDGVSAPVGFNNPAMIRSKVQNDWPSWFAPDTWTLRFNYTWAEFPLISTESGQLDVTIRWNGSSLQVNSHDTERASGTGGLVLAKASSAGSNGAITSGTGTDTTLDRIIFAGRPASVGPCAFNHVHLERSDATAGMHIMDMHGVGGDTTGHVLTDLNAQSDAYLTGYMDAALTSQTAQATKRVVFNVVLGGNDFSGINSVSESVFKANMQSLITRIDAIAALGGLSSSEYVIMLTGYHPRTADDDFGYRAAQSELADENTNVAFYDPAEEYTIGEMTSWWDGGSDNAHLTDAGYKEFANKQLTVVSTASDVGVGTGASKNRSRSRSRATDAGDYI